MQQFIGFIQSNLVLSLVWAGLLLALIISAIKQKMARYKILSPSDATLLVNRENAVFVDIRTRDEYRAGHIAGSLNVLGKDIKANALGEIEKYKSAPIILVCKTGQSAVEISKVLATQGFENLNLLKDGLISWNEANLPLIRGKKKK